MRAGRTIEVDAQGNVRSIDEDETRQRLASLAWLLDNSIRVPGTNFRIGVEALIGLFPVVGDMIGVLLSSYIVSEAARLGAPKAVLGRMAFHVAVEGLAGMVPFAGDVFDAVYKANQRNVRLLNAWLDEPRRTVRSSRLFGLGLAAAVIAGVALLGLAGWALVRGVAGLF